MTNEQINVAIGKWEGPIPRFFAGRLYVEDDVQGGTGDTPDEAVEDYFANHGSGRILDQVWKDQVNLSVKVVTRSSLLRELSQLNTRLES
jgi:hypothetical protein